MQLHKNINTCIKIINNMKTILKVITAIALVLIGALLPIKTEARRPSSLSNNTNVVPHIRMFGINVEKWRIDDQEVVRTIENDTLLIAAVNSKTIIVKSQQFGFYHVFLIGNCQYSQKTYNATTNRGNKYAAIRDIFSFAKGQGLIYYRPTGMVITPYLTVAFEGFGYTYKLYYLEVYNSKYSKWERVDVLGVNAESDHILNFLKTYVAK